MLTNLLKNAIKAILLAAISALPAIAQSINVKVEKGITPVPKTCESIVPANIEGQVDIKALVKEANCKGSGDMLADYTYVLKSLKRERRSKGEAKEETRVYEVFMPTLPRGVRARGILLLTKRNGLPVPPEELEKERLRAGERLEKEERRVALLPISQPQTTPNLSNRMSPIGMYSKSGFGGGSAVISVHTFLTMCDFRLIRREQIDGREMLVFTFTPRADAQFKDNEKYIAQLKGVIWIDAKDRIVARLAGWPQPEEVATEQLLATQANERRPAVYVEMMRLPAGVWLPVVMHLNGTDYSHLFNDITFYSTLTFSEYKRFTTEIEDLKLETREQPW